MPLRSDFLHLVQERGFLHQATDLEALDAKLLEGPQTAYIGFDLTADSLHVGSLLQIMLLYWWQQSGNRPLVLLGGGTTRIGDPSGKDASRQLLSQASIDANYQGIRSIFSAYLDFGEVDDDSSKGEAKGAHADSHSTAMMANNADWLAGLNYIDFLRDYGPHFSINRMLSFDSVRLRLEREQPLTFLEFNYMLLQAYDFLELYKRYDCIAQFGGSDQWGNIVNGIELGRRIAGAPLFGLTTPLLTTASGAKMGKTAAGAVWLNEARLPHFDFYQFWRNSEDDDVGRFLRLFTDLPLDEIRRLDALQGAELNEAKARLAYAVTRLARGQAAADSAQAAAEGQFGGSKDGGGLPEIHSAMPTSGGLSVLDLLQRAGFAESNGEARRLIRNRGARLNDQLIEDEQALIEREALQTPLKVSSGKKRHVMLHFG